MPNISVSADSLFTWTAEADSGYVTFAMAMDLFEKNDLISADFNKGTTFESSDTIGNYYRTGNRFVMCIEDPNDDYMSSSFIVAEIEPVENGHFRLVARKEMAHANYDCCNEGFFDRFQKCSPAYFLVKRCVTGSDYCGAFLYVFRDVAHFGEAVHFWADMPAELTYWFCEEGRKARCLKADFEFTVNGDVLTVYMHERTLRESTRKVLSVRDYLRTFTFSDNQRVPLKSVEVKSAEPSKLLFGRK